MTVFQLRDPLTLPQLHPVKALLKVKKYLKKHCYRPVQPSRESAENDWSEKQCDVSRDELSVSHELLARRIGNAAHGTSTVENGVI